MSTRATNCSFNDVESPIVPSGAVVFDDLDDESLDDLYAVQDADIDDFSRGGK